MNHTEWQDALKDYKATIGARVLVLKGEAGTNGDGRSSDTVDNATGSNHERQRVMTLFQLMETDRKIDALLKLTEDEYNICIECEEPIEERRLRALLGGRAPEIRTLRQCIKCLQAKEDTRRWRRPSELYQLRAQ